MDGLQALLRGAVAVESLENTFDVRRSLPYGHVAAVLGTLRKIGLDKVILIGRTADNDILYLQ